VSSDWGVKADNAGSCGGRDAPCSSERTRRGIANIDNVAAIVAFAPAAVGTTPTVTAAPMLVSAAFAGVGDNKRRVVSVGRYALRSRQCGSELFTLDPSAFV
jgi:hypothetical protein